MDDCNIALAQKRVSAEELNDARLAALRVEGMNCANCATRVHNALLALDGVVSADVDWERGLAIVDYVPAKTDPDALARTVQAAGKDERHHYLAQLISLKEEQ